MAPNLRLRSALGFDWLPPGVRDHAGRVASSVEPFNPKNPRLCKARRSLELHKSNGSPSLEYDAPSYALRATAGKPSSFWREPRTKNEERRTQNAERRTKNAERRTQREALLAQKHPSLRKRGINAMFIATIMLIMRSNYRIDTNVHVRSES
jgi:hypothetical protein